MDWESDTQLKFLDCLKLGTDSKYRSSNVVVPKKTGPRTRVTYKLAKPNPYTEDKEEKLKHLKRQRVAISKEVEKEEYETKQERKKQIKEQLQSKNDDSEEESSSESSSESSYETESEMDTLEDRKYLQAAVDQLMGDDAYGSMYRDIPDGLKDLSKEELEELDRENERIDKLLEEESEEKSKRWEMMIKEWERENKLIS